MKKVLLYILIMTAVLALCIGLNTTRVQAAVESDLTFTKTGNNGYTVTACNKDAAGHLTIPSTYNGKPIIAIGDSAFEQCTKLTGVSIPDSVTRIGVEAFRQCSNLTSITIPDSVTYIGGYAFANCNGLTNVTIPSSVTKMDMLVFFGCTNLAGIWVDENNPEYSSDSYGVLFNKDKTTLIEAPGAIRSYTIPDTVTAITNKAFWYCTKLTDVIIPDSVTTIGLQAFCYCTSLTSATIGKGVISIGSGAFEDCRSLTNVTIPDSVTEIGSGAFLFCNSLTSVTIGKGVARIYGIAFSGCPSLAGIWVDENNPEYSSDSYGVLFNKDKTTIIAAPRAIQSYTIPDSVTTIGTGAFNGCANLKNITIPDSVTSIKRTVFSNCTGLEHVIIPDGVTTIESTVFSGCTGLKYVIIPDGVTTIGISAFSGCTGLERVTIPVSVTGIGNQAFSYCTKLTDVYYTGTKEQWHVLPVGDNNEYLRQATIHYVNYCGAYGHAEEIIPGIAPTETEAGLTEGKRCTRCNEILVAQEVIPIEQERDGGLLLCVLIILGILCLAGGVGAVVFIRRKKQK